MNYYYILLFSTFIFYFSQPVYTYAQNAEKAREINNTVETNTKNNDLNIEEGLPIDYPKDLPMPIGSICKGYILSLDGTDVLFESFENPEIIYNAFKSEIESIGYKEDSGGSMISDNGGVALWKKQMSDKNDVFVYSLMLAWNKEKNLTNIVITYSK